MASFDNVKHGNGECQCHSATKGVIQTINEMDFERGIWNAAIYNETDRIKDFIKKGCVNDRDNSGYTALHYASRNGNEEICKLLITAGADINAITNGGVTSLHRAGMMGHNNIVKLLIQSGADIKLQDQDGQTVLHRAVENCHLIVTKSIIEYSPELKYIKDNKNRIPFDLVSNSNNEEFKVLLMLD